MSLLNDDYSTLKVPELKHLASSVGITGYSRLKRANLITRLTAKRNSTRRASASASAPASAAKPVRIFKKHIEVAEPKNSTRRVNAASVAKPVRIFKKHLEVATVEEEGEDDEAVCEGAMGGAGGPVDERKVACAKNEVREDSLFKCFKGQTVSDETLDKAFACGSSKLRSFVADVIRRYPTLQATIQRQGGRGENYDYYFQDSGIKNIELKTGKSTTSLAALEKKPWNGYGQFFQAFLNNKQPFYSEFLSFAKPMLHRWYTTVIVPNIIPRYGITGDVDFESYYKAVFIPDQDKLANHKDISLGIKNLFKFFRESGICGGNKVEKKIIGDLWKGYINQWFSENNLSTEQLLRLIQNSLSKKQYWICTTKNDAYWIEGPQCDSIRFKSLKKGKDVTVAIYEAVFKKPSEASSYTADIEFRLTWRNCSQGVHNIAFQVS